MKKTLITITMLTLVFAMVLTGNVSAAATVTVTAPTEAVAVGDEVVVTIKPSENLVGLEFELTYDPAVLDYTGEYTGSAGTNGYTLVNEATEGEITAVLAKTGDAVDMTVTLTFTALVASEGTEISVGELYLENAEGSYTPDAVTSTVAVAEEVPPVDPETPVVPETPVDPVDPEDPANPGETTTNDPKPGIPQTGANIFAYVVSGIVLVAVLALVVKTKKD